MLRRRPELFALAVACTLLIALAVTGAPEGVPFNEVWASIDKLQASSVPDGTIVMWSGRIADIPTGWALCDGTNDTPDLTDQFIMSVSGSSEDPGESGGEECHTHNVTHSHMVSIDPHNHDYDPPDVHTDYEGTHSHATKPPTSQIEVGNAPHWPFVGTWVATTLHTHTTESDGKHRHSVEISSATTQDAGGVSKATSTHSASAQAADHLPPYYKLAFIMKL